MVDQSVKTIKHAFNMGYSIFLDSMSLDLARRESERLVAHGLGLTRTQMYSHFNKPLTEDQLSILLQLFKERASGKPFEYITGEADYRYLKLKVDNRVLIPRPETELIVDLALNIITDLQLVPDRQSVLELGTGSGAIALSIAKEAGVKVLATDISAEALEVAKENGRLNEIDKVEWRQSDWFSDIEGRFDLIVSNPPYISENEFFVLSTGVKDFEPTVALTDKGDGFNFLRKIASEAPNYLTPNGRMVLEISYNQKEGVAKLLKANGFKDIYFEKDYSGHDRFALATVA